MALLAKTVGRQRTALKGPAVAAQMSDLLPSQIAESVMQRFGINVNTRVIRDGHPIRMYVANRLLQRLQWEMDCVPVCHDTLLIP